MSDQGLDDEPDPIFASSIHEMKAILLIWLVGFVWVIGCCLTFGYRDEGENISTTLGIPSWAFWGVFVPYITLAAITSWFAMCKMKDHPLIDDDDAETDDV